RFGRRRGGVVVVPLDLTHETLSLLAGARRPSVTTALGGLARQGSLTKNGTGEWVLHGPPPGLVEVPEACIEEAAAGLPTKVTKGDCGFLSAGTSPARARSTNLRRSFSCEQPQRAHRAR